MKYLYTVSGFYVHQPSPGEYNEGHLSGEAVIYDVFNEITEPPGSVYDEWYVHSYNFNAAGYAFEGKNGKIKRFETSNSLIIDYPSWTGESEQIYITNTGPNAIPPESMSFNDQGGQSFFDLEDGSSMKITTIKFEKRRIANPCPPRCFLSWICEWLCQLFGKR